MARHRNVTDIGQQFLILLLFIFIEPKEGVLRLVKKYSSEYFGIK